VFRSKEQVQVIVLCVYVHEKLKLQEKCKLDYGWNCWS